MKKIICSLLSVSLLLMSLSSCTTLRQEGSTVRTTDIYGPGVLQHPAIAEMDVDINKVEGMARSSQMTVDQLKALAIKNALEQSAADILVEPSFEIEQRASDSIVKVSGFPATYTGFRPLEHDDIPLIEAGQLQKAYTAEATDTGRESSGSGLMAGLIGIGAAVLLLILLD